jgi:Arc/MetJ family transcription regulator
MRSGGVGARRRSRYRREHARLQSDLFEELAADVLRSWKRRQERVDLTLAPLGREMLSLGSDSLAVSEALPDLVRWLTGRGAYRLVADVSEIPGFRGGWTRFRAGS